MPAIKLQESNSIYSRSECSPTIGVPALVESQGGEGHESRRPATNYLKSYCRIKRHGVNNSKTLCWLTLTLILLANRFGMGTAVGTPETPAAVGSMGCWRKCQSVSTVETYLHVLILNIKFLKLLSFFKKYAI